MQLHEQENWESQASHHTERFQQQFERADLEEQHEAFAKMLRRQDRQEGFTEIGRTEGIVAEKLLQEEEQQRLHLEALTRMELQAQQIIIQKQQLEEKVKMDLEDLRLQQQQEAQAVQDHLQEDLQQLHFQQRADLQLQYEKQSQQLEDMRQQHAYALQHQRELQQQQLQQLQALQQQEGQSGVAGYSRNVSPESAGDNELSSPVHVPSGFARHASLGSSPMQAYGGRHQSARSTEEEIYAALRDALGMFRPDLGKGPKTRPDGSRSLGCLAANLAALSAYAQAELQEISSAKQIDHRREQYSLADSRFARERRFADEWEDRPAPPPPTSVAPFAVN